MNTEPFDKYIRFPFYVVILTVLISSFFILLFVHFFVTDDPALANIDSIVIGFISGIGIYIIQFLFSLQQYRENHRIKSLGVLKIFPHREDREFYGNFLKSGKDRIDIMGVTTIRLLEHFADEHGVDEGCHILLKALVSNVPIRILACGKEYLEKEDDRINTVKATRRLKELSAKYDNFKYAYYDHVPTHSVFLVDDKLIVGPIFPNVSSKYTPCMLIRKESKYAKRYLDYFENEWSRYFNE